MSIAVFKSIRIKNMKLNKLIRQMERSIDETDNIKAK